MRYDVTHSDNLEELIHSVQEAMQDGWQPVGGIAVHQEQGDKVWFFQAMTIWEYPSQKYPRNSFKDKPPVRPYTQGTKSTG